MTDILLIEDNIQLAELIITFLEKDGFQVTAVANGEDALKYLQRNKAKLVLLDIMLPGMDGFAVCASIREASNIPIIIISARVEKEDKMNGFLLGADDYVEKPVDIDILSAKAGALMRRNYSLKSFNQVLCSGSISIDKETRQVFLKEKEITVTSKEYELLMLFVENPGKTLHKEFLFDRVWGMDSFSENQTLTVHVKMLRDKIEEDPKRPMRIITVWGVGYRYEEI